MSNNNVVLGWLKDKESNKIAPKTLSSQVSYNNELSKLSSSTAQGAIDELANKVKNVSSTADKITFDKEDTDMVSTNIQDAILEIWSELQLRALKSFEVVYMVDSGVGYKEEVQLGATALLPETFTPQKEDYTFIGWRADNQASSEVLNECTVGEDPIVLYAVFRKEYQATFISNGNPVNKSAYEYYNNNNINSGSVIAPNGVDISGYTWKGWSAPGATSASAGVAFNNGDIITDISSDVTIYGLYEKVITLSYDGNSPTGGETLAQTGLKKYNASGASENPSFTVNPCGFTRTNGVFVNWAAGSRAGSRVESTSVVTLSDDIVYYAVWRLTQTGNYSFSFWGNSSYSTNITFATPYYTTPSITSHYVNSNYSSKNTGHIASKKANSVTKTGFTAYLGGDGDGSQGIWGTATWVAVGEV